MPIILKGKCSWFGGPHDFGVTKSENLALFDHEDVNKKPYQSLFLQNQPYGTTGVARRLDPQQHYIACRWDYHKTPREYLRSIFVNVENVRTGIASTARPVDWGPNKDTGRVADLSPGLLNYLDMRTDEEVQVTIPLPGETIKAWN